MLVVILGIAGGAYYLGKSSSKPQSQSAITKSQISPSPTISSSQPPFGSPPPYYSPKPIPQNILSAITVIPINARQFEKRIVDNDDCTKPVGLVSYHDNKTGNSMKINSTRLATTDPFKSSMQSILSFINHTMVATNNMDIKDWDFAFRDYCGGAASYIHKEIKNINYPNTTQARAIEVIGGNGGIGFGEIRVYATKGDNIIQLDTILVDVPLYKNINDDCYEQSNKAQNYSKEFDFQCIQRAALSHPELDQDAINKVNILINQFAIK